MIFNTDSLGLISRSQHEKPISQVELVLVCNILAEALLGNHKPHTEVSRNIGDFPATARSVILYQPNEFALFLFMAPIRVSDLWCCHFTKWEEIRQCCFWCGCRIPCWLRVPESCVSSTQSPLFKHLHLYLMQAVRARRQSHSLCSCSPGIEAQFGFFVIFKKSNLPRDQVPTAAVFALCFI